MDFYDLNYRNQMILVTAKIDEYQQGASQLGILLIRTIQSHTHFKNIVGSLFETLMNYSA